MNKDTLALLSGMAPKPEQWAVDEFEAKFKDDYPEPAIHKWLGMEELLNAVSAVERANYFAKFGAPVDEKGAAAVRRELAARTATAQMVSSAAHNRGVCAERFAWGMWMVMCRNKWARDEWPLIWAKKRLQAAQED